MSGKLQKFTESQKKATWFKWDDFLHICEEKYFCADWGTELENLLSKP